MALKRRLPKSDFTGVCCQSVPGLESAIGKELLPVVIEKNAPENHSEDDRQDQTERRKNNSSNGYALAFGIHTERAKHDTNDADKTPAPKNCRST
jgi:hypothetical protein